MIKYLLIFKRGKDSVETNKRGPFTDDDARIALARRLYHSPYNETAFMYVRMDIAVGRDDDNDTEPILNVIAASELEVRDEREYPVACPFCKGSDLDLRTNVATWKAQSEDDEDNVVTLIEHQCIPCGRPFWL